MRNAIIVAERFYENPHEVLAYAHKLQYHYPYAESKLWLSSEFKQAEECPFKSARIIAALEQLIGEKIDRDHWHSTFPIDRNGHMLDDWQSHHPRSCRWNGTFHVKFGGTGLAVHNHVTDTWNAVGENGWAGLIYLSPNAPVEGGLKLWEPKEPNRRYDWMTPIENWTLIDTIGNVFNRLILCRGNLPHSGAKGWGSSCEDGRFFQTFFFQVKHSSLRSFSAEVKGVR